MGTFPTDLLIGPHYFAHVSLEKHGSIAVLEALTADDLHRSGFLVASTGFSGVSVAPLPQLLLLVTLVAGLFFFFTCVHSQISCRFKALIKNALCLQHDEAGDSKSD